MPTRRKLLAAAAALTAAGAAGVGATAWRWWDQPVHAGWSFLSADEVAFLEAMADALFPPGGTPPLAGADADLARFFDGCIQAWEPTQRKLIRLLLHALDTWTWPAHQAPFSALGIEDRQAVIQGWIGHPLAEIRGAAVSVILFLGMGYTIHPDTADTFAPLYGCRYGA